MSKAAREGLYECVFRSGTQRYSTYVRAWDEREAVELFQVELRLDGIGGDGTIEVKQMGGAAGQSAMQALVARIEQTRLQP